MLPKTVATLALLLAFTHTVSAQTGTLAPVPQQVFLSSSGTPLNGGLVYFYLAGTTTLSTTWSDQALTTPNSNPVVLNSAGRNTAGGIYLSTSVLYKVVVKTSAGVTVYSQDNVSPSLTASVASSDNATCDGRLSLTTATAVTTADVTAATTIFWVPYHGNRCALYDGSSTWSIVSFSELSLALGTDAANTNWDVFLYTSSGTATLERVAWTSATVRATNITLQNGVYVKSSDTTHRYLGTYRTTTTIGQTEDSASKRLVWNFYNRVRRPVAVLETTDSWTYTTSAFRQANNSTANQIAIVVGVAEVPLSLTVTAHASNASTNAVIIGIGEDGLTATTGSIVGQASTGLELARPIASLTKVPAIGYHYYAWLEYSGAVGSTTWYGDNANATFLQSGIVGTIEG